MFNIQRAITLKVGNKSYGLMVFNICVKFHENMSIGFKVMERTRTMLTDTHTQKRRKLYTPLHTLYAGGITRVTTHVFCTSFHGV